MSAADESMNSRQFLTLDSEEGLEKEPKPPNPQGTYISYVNLFILVLFGIAVAAVVGLVVHFVHPARNQKCDSRNTVLFSSPATTLDFNTNKTWNMCCQLGMDRGSCLPGCPCLTVTTEDTTLPDEVTTSPTQSPKPTNLRLPHNLKPYHYHIKLRPDFYDKNPSNFTNTGSVDIYLECKNVTDTIYVHFRKLTIDNSTLNVTNVDTSIPIQIDKTSVDIPREFYKVHLKDKLSIGDRIKLNMDFEGTIKKDMQGLFWTSYKFDNETRYLLATQFESTYARKTFPCLDEPGFRATFKFTLERKPGWIALTNTPNISSTALEDGWVRDVFDVTPFDMPTYLVAFAISDFEFRDDTSANGHYMRQWTKPSRIAHVTFARDVSPKMLDFFEDYFNESYIMKKTDQISVPDFTSGAMENWGLITYTPSRLVWDNEYDTWYNRQRAAGTISHELLHQWLGNIITCAWWDDIWLQEGMARYYQHLGVDHVRPSWDMEHVFILQTFRRVLRRDSQGNGQPVFNPVSTVSEIASVFSSFTYDKGGSVIRMMSDFMGNNTFKQGMRDYIQKHKYGNTKHDDLFKVLDKAVDSDNVTLPLSVRDTMHTWIKQMGYPVITVEITASDRIKLSQKIFLDSPDTELKEKYPSQFGYKWQVPVRYVVEQTQKWTNPDLVWLPKNGTEVYLNVQKGRWFLANVKQIGYYRVNYDNSGWDSLIDQLNTQHTVLDVINRAQLIDDSNTFARTGLLDQVLAIQTMEYLYNETEYLPWSDADTHIAYINIMFYRTPKYATFRAFVRNLFKRNYQRLGWDSVNNERLMDNYLRVLTLTRSCYFGSADCQSEALRRFRLWMNNGVINNSNKSWADIRDVVYCGAVKAGGITEWEFILQQFKTEEHRTDKDRLRKALLCTEENWLLYRLIDFNSTDVTKSYRSRFLYDLAGSSSGRHLAWDFLREHWDIIGSSRTGILRNIANGFSSDFEYKELSAFINSKRKSTDSASLTRAYDAMLKVVNRNRDWRNKYEQHLFEWLKDAVKKQG